LVLARVSRGELGLLALLRALAGLLLLDRGQGLPGLVQHPVEFGERRAVLGERLRQHLPEVVAGRLQGRLDALDPFEDGGGVGPELRGALVVCLERGEQLTPELLPELGVRCRQALLLAEAFDRVDEKAGDDALAGLSEGPADGAQRERLDAAARAERLPDVRRHERGDQHGGDDRRRRGALEPSALAAHRVADPAACTVAVDQRLRHAGPPHSWPIPRAVYRLCERLPPGAQRRVSA
jgi:hypothetical protein